MVGFTWVKAHVGIPRNELADQQSKLSITSSEELFIPAPYSHLKRLIKNYIVEKWNEYWNSYDSASGIRLRCYILRDSDYDYEMYTDGSRIGDKDNLYNAKDLVSLVWVKAHAGNPGNELADHFEKIASSCGADMSIPAPYSYVKRVCKEFLMNEWNSYWKNSTTGKRTKEILPLANMDLLSGLICRLSAYQSCTFSSISVQVQDFEQS
ncbi:hypothetical protein AVEN_244533-1 [Araneus ventricosus]|uniref:RNase H type-1 domain-containing protein n=1 Tax=Araneus ventricosus TaxID=182803 RepID=A0A4Y2F5R4_ARAVE|nr:hypothetical protein AVEN_244533-1 [Araneus ventricosus]